MGFKTPLFTLVANSEPHRSVVELTSIDFGIRRFLRFFAFGYGKKDDSRVVIGEAGSILIQYMVTQPKLRLTKGWGKGLLWCH